MNSHLRLLLLISLGLLSSACSESQSPTEPAQSSSSTAPLTATVEVTGGTIRGTAGADGLKQYHGIPYAAPPVGDLRWAPPAPPASWTGTRDASRPGPLCMQPLSQGGAFYGQTDVNMDEDCLTLNVWTRAQTREAALPVMVWIHGGALVTGGGAAYPGELLTSGGVVLVTINYRLGRFGFHAHPELSKENPSGVSGNQGLRDQIAALEWVQENIAAFGGDPGRVTILGESAGSLSVSLLQASPMARGLFHGVIGQSGASFQPMWFRDRATSYAPSAESVGSAFGVAAAGEGNDASLAALRALPAEQVQAATDKDPNFLNYDGLAIVDGEVIPKEVAEIFAQGEQADVPVMIGSNADEATTFIEFFTMSFGEGETGYTNWRNLTLPEVAADMDTIYNPDDPTRAWVDAFSDALFAYPMRAWARDMQKVSSDAYLYWFTWHPPVENQDFYRAFHAGEIGYIFGNLTLFNASPTDADRAFSDKLSTIWTQFAKTGNPNGNDIPDWPAFSIQNEAYMELGPEIASGSNLRLEEMALIEKAWQIRRDASQGEE